MCLKCESGSSRFQLGEGRSRGLLRDYEPSDGPPFQALLLTACFEALQARRAPAGHVRGAAALLQLGARTLAAAAALVQRVLAALAARGRGRALSEN